MRNPQYPRINVLPTFMRKCIPKRERKWAGISNDRRFQVPPPAWLADKNRAAKIYIYLFADRIVCPDDDDDRDEEGYSGSIQGSRCCSGSSSQSEKKERETPPACMQPKLQTLLQGKENPSGLKPCWHTRTRANWWESTFFMNLSDEGGDVHRE